MGMGFVWFGGTVSQRSFILVLWARADIVFRLRKGSGCVQDTCNTERIAPPGWNHLVRTTRRLGQSAGRHQVLVAFIYHQLAAHLRTP